MITSDHPFYIQFYPTLSCNLSCDFCFNRNLKPTQDINVIDFKKIVSVLRELEIPFIDILGGEPTLHPDLMKLMALTNQYGLRTNISSNGTNVNALKTLSEKYDRDSVRIGISINSSNLSDNLHHYILTYKPVIKSIFDRSGMIPESCQPYVGLPGIDYFLLYLDVLDHDDLKNIVPFYDYHRKLNEIQSIYNGVNGVYCSGFIPDKEHHPFLEFVRCPAGTTKLSILPDGSVYPCYLFFRHQQFELGNILYDDFDKIWQHPMLDNFRRFHKNKCPKTSCELFGTCHGGCPATSFQFYKNLSGPDPRCMRDGWGNKEL